MSDEPVQAVNRLALEFDGVDDIVDISSLEHMGQTMTMEAFVTAKTVQQDRRMFGFSVFKLEADALKRDQIEPLSDIVPSARKVVLTVGKRHHVCKIFDGESLLTYVDGAKVRNGALDRAS